MSFRFDQANKKTSVIYTLKLFRLFPGYLPSKTIEKSLSFDRSSGYKNDKAVFHHSTPAWALVLVRSTSNRVLLKRRRNTEEINLGAEIIVTVSELFSQRTDRICELTKQLNR